MSDRAVKENDRWILSFYRASEIGGALLLGRLATCPAPGAIQRDLTRHFSEEAQHAWYWTECLDRLGTTPLKVDGCYQDRYLAAAGIPANLMEVLAATHAFERRVIGQYALHARAPGLAPAIAVTFERIMEDERWHLAWISEALREMETSYGAAQVEAARRRYIAADLDVYRRVLDEYAERLADLPRFQGAGR